MKTKLNVSTVRGLTAVAILGAALPSRAGDVGHYVGGLMDSRDYFVPDPGFYGGLYNYFYSSDRFNDQNGNKISTITIQPGPGPGKDVNVEVDLDMYVLVPSLIWVSPWTVLGAKYAAYVAPSFANANIQSAISTVRIDGSASQSTFAPGDLYVQPLWLGWSQPHWDVSAAYGFYAPVGRYSTDTTSFPGGSSVTLPASDNIGLGFWTQQFQGAVAWYPMTNKATAVVTALTYNYNSEQQGTEVTPGQNLWLTWGISQYLPLKKDDTLLLEVGPAGYYEWQISDSTGRQVTNPDSRTTVSAIGGQIGITSVPWNLILNFRGFYEYHAE